MKFHADLERVGRANPMFESSIYSTCELSGKPVATAALKSVRTQKGVVRILIAGGG